MESIKKLRQKVAKSSISHFAPRHDVFVRKISIYITWLLLHTPLSANAVTVLQIIVGVSGGLLLCSQDYGVNFLGIFLLQFGYILDCCDGEIARYRNQSSVNGVFIDLIGHEIVIPMMYIGLAIGEFQRTGGLFIIFCGFLAGLFSLRFDISAMFQTVNTLFMKSDNSAYDFQKLAKSQPSRTTELATTRPSLLRVLFRYPEAMNVITILLICDFYILQVWPNEFAFIRAFLCLYGLLIPAARVWSIHKMFSNAEVERKYIEIVNHIQQKKKTGAE